MGDYFGLNARIEKCLASAKRSYGICKYAEAGDLYRKAALELAIYCGIMHGECTREAERALEIYAFAEESYVKRLKLLEQGQNAGFDTKKSAEMPKIKGKLAETYREMGELRITTNQNIGEALALLEKAGTLYLEARRYGDAAKNLTSLAQLQCMVGNCENALESYKRAFASYLRGGDYWDAKNVMGNAVGMAEKYLKDKEIQLCGWALEECEKAMGKECELQKKADALSCMGWIENVRGMSERCVGNEASALESYARALKHYAGALGCHFKAAEKDLDSGKFYPAILAHKNAFKLYEEDIKKVIANVGDCPESEEIRAILRGEAKKLSAREYRALNQEIGPIAKKLLDAAGNLGKMAET